jgi:hypothetical protein
MPSTINEDRIIALTRALRGLPSSTLSAMLVSVLSGDPFRYEVEGQVLSQGKFMSDEQNVETSKYDEHHTDHVRIVGKNIGLRRMDGEGAGFIPVSLYPAFCVTYPHEKEASC